MKARVPVEGRGWGSRGETCRGQEGGQNFLGQDCLGQKDCLVQDSLRQVLAAYGWAAESPRRVQTDVWQVGGCCLKRLACEGARGILIAHAMLQLRQNGFAGASVPVPAVNGDLVVEMPGAGVWLACRWLAGTRCSFQQPEQLQAAAALLGRFHQNAQGLYPPGERSRYFGHPLRLARQQQSLLACRVLAQQENSPFARRYLALFQENFQRGQQAAAQLAAAPYPVLAAAEEKIGRFCHGDIAARNFIMTDQQQAYLIDFGSCRQDLAVVDLVHLLRRALADLAWDETAASQILQAYCSSRPLPAGESQVAAALLLYPQHYFRLGQRYFQRETWDKEHLARSLEHLYDTQSAEQTGIAAAVCLLQGGGIQ